jgi:hypothetical protein
MNGKTILGAALVAIVGLAMFKKPKGAAEEKEEQQEPQGGMMGGGDITQTTVTKTTTTQNRFLPKFTTSMVKEPLKVVMQTDKTQSFDISKVKNAVLSKPPTIQQLQQTCERGYSYNRITKQCEPIKVTTSGSTVGGTTGGTTYGGGTSGFKTKQGAEMLFSGNNPLTLDNLLH